MQLKLVGLQPSRFQHLVSQLLFRLSEGGGEAIYRIGLRDCGWPEGLPDPELQANSLGPRRFPARNLRAHAPWRLLSGELIS